MSEQSLAPLPPIVSILGVLRETNLGIFAEETCRCTASHLPLGVTNEERDANLLCINKHRCFLPGGNNTSPSLMFLSLKLEIRGLNPQSSITLPLGVATNHFAKVKIRQRRTCKNLLKNSHIKENKQIYYSSQSEHNLII